MKPVIRIPLRSEGASRKLLSAILISQLFLGACSVKENRSPCPSMLIVNTEALQKSQEGFSMHVWGEDSYHFWDTVLYSEYPTEWKARVQKGNNIVYGFIGLGASEFKDSQIIIPKGKASSPLFTHYSEVDCHGEYSYDVLELHKQFCVLTINLETFENVDLEYPYDIEVLGSSCGFDLLTSQPIDGEFHCVPTYLSDNVREVILPRMKEVSELRICLKVDGDTKVELDLGRILQEGGYSWTQADLADVEISVHFYLNTTIELNIIDWTNISTLNPVI